MPVRSAEPYDPATGICTLTGSLHGSHSGHTATLLSNGKVLIAGEFGTVGATNSAEVYDPDSAAWTQTGSLLTNRESCQDWADLYPGGSVIDPSEPATGEQRVVRGGH